MIKEVKRRSRKHLTTASWVVWSRFKQASFEASYSRIISYKRLNKLHKRCNQYRKQFCVAFVSHEKPFDSVYWKPVMKASELRGMRRRYCRRIPLAEVFKNLSRVKSNWNISRKGSNVWWLPPPHKSCFGTLVGGLKL